VDHDLHFLLVAAAINAFFSLGQYTWMSTWLPELYPTRMRATGVAFVFNAPRFIAFLGPLIAGALIADFGGYGNAATIVASIYILGLLARRCYRKRVGCHYAHENHHRKLPEALAAWLSRRARELGRSQSDLVREALQRVSEGTSGVSCTMCSLTSVA